MLSDDESFRESKHFHSLSVEEIRFVATAPRAKRSSSFCQFYCMHSKIGLAIANSKHEIFYTTEILSK
jgi:hypothetical protein